MRSSYKRPVPGFSVLIIIITHTVVNIAKLFTILMAQNGSIVTRKEIIDFDLHTIHFQISLVQKGFGSRIISNSFHTYHIIIQHCILLWIMPAAPDQNS